MKFLDFNSPYAQVGMFFALMALAVSTLYDTNIRSAPTGPLAAYEVSDVRGARPAFKWKDVEDVEFIDRVEADEEEWQWDGGNEDYANFKKVINQEAQLMKRPVDYVPAPDLTKEPCYSVLIDPTVEGYDETHPNVFGPDVMSGTEDFLTELETLLIEEFTKTSWDGSCFQGSFVVSFNVTAEGGLGHTIIVHHLVDGGKQAMPGVYQMLRDMHNSGFRWHDGTKGEGEIRIPVRFRIG